MDIEDFNGRARGKHVAEDDSVCWQRNVRFKSHQGAAGNLQRIRLQDIRWFAWFPAACASLIPTTIRQLIVDYCNVLEPCFPRVLDTYDMGVLGYYVQPSVPSTLRIRFESEPTILFPNNNRVASSRRRWPVGITGPVVKWKITAPLWSVGFVNPKTR